MAASCAACLLPIAKGDKFVLSGTEVFHGRCTMRVGTTRSIRARLELRVIEVERDLSLVRDQLENQRTATASEREIARRTERERDGIDRELRVARAARDAALRDSTYWQERGRAEKADGDRLAAALRADLARARADLAAAQARRPLEPTEGQQVAKEDRDATEIRFSLLELDKP